MKHDVLNAHKFCFTLGAARASLTLYALVVLSVLLVLQLVKIVCTRVVEFFQVDVASDKPRFIFVTSSDDVLGRKLVQSLDEEGFSVIAGCETRYGADTIKKKCSENVLPVVYDISKAASVEDTCTFITRYLPANTGLWAILHNYHIVTPPSLFEWTRTDAINNVLNIQLGAALLFTKKLLPWLRRARGRIVMTTTDGCAGFPTWIEHEVVSGGLAAFCKCLRLELCKTGVSVHTVGIPVFHPHERSRELIRHRIHQLYDDLIPETQGYYGDGYTTFLAGKTYYGPQLDPGTVSDLYLSAVQQRYPRRHYASSGLRSFIDRFVSSLPRPLAEMISTWAVPVPEGLKWCRGFVENE